MTMIATPSAVDSDLLRQLRAEFEDLPAMRLTFEQVVRLLNVDAYTCADALQALMADGFLTRSGAVYMKLDRPCRYIGPALQNHGEEEAVQTC